MSDTKSQAFDQNNSMFSMLRGKRAWYSYTCSLGGLGCLYSIEPLAIVWYEVQAPLSPAHPSFGHGELQPTRLMGLLWHWSGVQMVITHNVQVCISHTNLANKSLLPQQWSERGNLYPSRRKWYGFHFFWESSHQRHCTLTRLVGKWVLECFHIHVWGLIPSHLIGMLQAWWALTMEAHGDFWSKESLYE